MQQFKHPPLFHLPWHLLIILFLWLLVGGTALGGFALLILGSDLRDVVVQALSLLLWSLLLALMLGVGGYGLLLLAGRARSFQRFAPKSSRAEEGWTALLLAAFGGIWLLVIQVWMQPGPHSDLWIIIWLLSMIILGFASIRRAVVHALIRLFGPRSSPE
jgi:hypothetical protein